MASRATHRGTPPPMPAEILQQICKDLDQPDLKQFRLVCKTYSYAAEITLFRQILLKRNVESFIKLRLIAGHPRISKLVKALCYSGMMLFNADMCKNLDGWFKAFIGNGFECRHQRKVCKFSKRLTSEELEVHYQRFCAHHHSEQLMQKYDIEIPDLTSAFAKLPQLEEVCFTCRDDYPLLSDGPISFDQLSSIARETLVEPESSGGFWFHAGQFTALLKAAHTVQKPLKTVKALDLPWHVFQQSKEVSAMMASATKACQYLAIEIRDGKDKENGRANLSKMISSSPSLQTLEISFGSPHLESRNWDLKLSDFFETGAHWPNLKRLKLQTLNTTDITLTEFLTTHASRLRSLELAHISLKHYDLDGTRRHGSWVEIIAFLKSSLSLETVRLGGNLCSGWDEVWCIHDPDESEYWRCEGERPPEEGTCLKHRIERFVVEGGTCPLPTPHDAKEAGGWASMDFGEDLSWSFCRRY